MSERSDGGEEAREALLTRAGRLIREYDAQGDHRTGSVVDQASAAWLADQVREAGTEPNLEPFALDRVEPVNCFLESGGQRFDGLPAFDGGVTDARGIAGTLGPLGSDAAIALLETSPNGEYNPAFRQALTEGTHRAFVVVTRGGLPGLAPVNAPRFTQPYGRPVLMVSSVDADRLNAQAEQRARVRLFVQAVHIPATAFNVTARIPGTNPESAPIVVMTPRSGWWNCASERGGGLVCWLEVLRAVSNAAPLRTVLFTANSGHELGHLGLTNFRQNHPELRGGVHCWVHFGANIGAYGSRVVLQCATDALREMAEDVLARHGLRADDLVGPGQIPAGEARNIHAAGEPYLSLLGRPGPVFHHPADRWPGWVNLPQLAALAAAQTELVLQMAAG